MPTLSSLMAPQVVITTICCAPSDNWVDIMTALGFQYILSFIFFFIYSHSLGRKKALSIVCVINLAAFVSTGFAPNYYVFLGLRFMSAFSSISVFTCYFVLCEYTATCFNITSYYMRHDVTTDVSTDFELTKHHHVIIIKSCKPLTQTKKTKKIEKIKKTKIRVATWNLGTLPDGKVHGAKMGRIWGRQDPGGPYVGPMNLVIWAELKNCRCDGNSLDLMSRHLCCAEIWVYGFPRTQPGPHSCGQGLQVQVFLLYTIRHTVDRELGKQNCWSPAHLGQDHSSQADNWLGTFHHPLRVRTSSDPTWSWQGAFLRPAAICYCQGPSHRDTHLSWWLELSLQHHRCCVQRCSWWAWLQCL